MNQGVRIIRCSLMTTVIALLAACGNRGDLYLPAEKAQKPLATAPQDQTQETKNTDNSPALTPATPQLEQH